MIEITRGSSNNIHARLVKVKDFKLFNKHNCTQLINLRKCDFDNHQMFWTILNNDKQKLLDEIKLFFSQDVNDTP